MKKLVLSMVSILLMALFIAFNYLLWDRENRVKELKDLELSNASNSAAMSQQNREIKSLEDENNTLHLRINELQNEQDQLTKSNDALAKDKDSLNRKMSLKTDLVNVLKKISDIKVLEQPVKKWLDAINAGEYDKAYEYEYTSLNSVGNPPGVITYGENLKSTVKSISLKSISVDANRGSMEGDIVLDVELDVKLVDNSVSKDFKEGLNEKFIKLTYDYTLQEFTILQITDY
jgi:hypothetical protein